MAVSVEVIKDYESGTGDTMVRAQTLNGELTLIGIWGLGTLAVENGTAFVEALISNTVALLEALRKDGVK